MLKNLFSLVSALALLVPALPALAASQKHEPSAPAEKVDLRIEGEIASGHTFSQDIGHGLVFLLEPTPGHPDVGWRIRIEPKDQPADGPIEFSGVATPPYRRYNPRFLEASWGNSASDAVKMSPRIFYFVQSVDDEHRAEECLNVLNYPTDASDEEKVRVAAEQKEILLGQGELRILKSHLGHPKPLAEEGTIESIRFEVAFQFSSGITMGDIVARINRPE